MPGALAAFPDPAVPGAFEPEGAPVVGELLCDELPQAPRTIRAANATIAEKRHRRLIEPPWLGAHIESLLDENIILKGRARRKSTGVFSGVTTGDRDRQTGAEIMPLCHGPAAAQAAPFHCTPPYLLQWAQAGKTTSGPQRQGGQDDRHTHRLRSRRGLNSHGTVTEILRNSGHPPKSAIQGVVNDWSSRYVAATTLRHYTWLLRDPGATCLRMPIELPCSSLVG